MNEINQVALSRALDCDVEKIQERASRRKSTSDTIVSGHDESFQLAADFISYETTSIQVFMVGGLRSPQWWRDKMKDCATVVRNRGGVLECEVILYLDEATVSPDVLQQIDQMQRDYVFGDVDLRILSDMPHLGSDVLVVDRRHVFLGIYAHRLDERVYGVHLDHPGLSQAVARWFPRLHNRSEPYEDWKQKVIVKKGWA